MCQKWCTGCGTALSGEAGDGILFKFMCPVCRQTEVLKNQNSQHQSALLDQKYLREAQEFSDWQDYLNSPAMVAKAQIAAQQCAVIDARVRQWKTSEECRVWEAKNAASNISHSRFTKGWDIISWLTFFALSAWWILPLTDWWAFKLIPLIMLGAPFTFVLYLPVRGIADWLWPNLPNPPGLTACYK